LEWQDDDGINHQWAMPLALLQGDASDVRKELARLGLAISPNRTSRDLLASYLFFL
jgi:putative DNA primase/helicase